MISTRLYPIFTLSVLILHMGIAGSVAAGGEVPETDTRGRLVLESSDDPRWEGIDALRSLFGSPSRSSNPLHRPFPLPDLGSPHLPPIDPSSRFSRDRIQLQEAGGEFEENPRHRPPRSEPLGWDSWQGPVDIRVAAHLCNRALIGPRFEEFQLVYSLGIEDAVEYLLTEQDLPDPPGDWIDEPIPHFRDLTPAQVDSVLMLYFQWGQETRMWWVDRIVNDQEGATETMVHFWHDHFAVELITVVAPQPIYRQNDLFRRHALGNLRELVRAVATDPAMLVYLDGYRNRVGNPNENFARELMELFTLGEGGGYTQTDVEEVARACTGWQTDGLQSYFVPSYHDYGQKTVLGQTGNFDIDDVVDIIFEQQATAEYLCGKIYRWFVDDGPAPEDIRELAGILRANDYEIKPLLAAIFRSKHLLDIKAFRGSIVRDGLDIYAGQLRRFHVSGFDPAADLEALQTRWVFYQMLVYDHVLLDPPNVAGWPGHHDWINTFTLPVRKVLSLMIVDGVVDRRPLGFKMNAMAEAERLTDPDDAFRLIDDVALLCFGRPPSDTVRQAMLDELLQGAEPYAWSMDIPGAQGRLEDLFRYAMRLPDYQLK